jgi:hypothetical protein
VSCLSSGLCVAVDDAGNVVTSSNPTAGAAAWAVNKVDGSYNSLRGVACPSSSLCVVVDDCGNVVTSSNPTGSVWIVTHIDGRSDCSLLTSGASPGSLGGVSCPSATQCVVVDSSGNVVTSSNPTGGKAAWKITNVDRAGAGLSSVSCPSPSLCVTVDGVGNVVIGTDQP